MADAHNDPLLQVRVEIELLRQELQIFGDTISEMRVKNMAFQATVLEKLDVLASKTQQRTIGEWGPDGFFVKESPVRPGPVRRVMGTLEVTPPQRSRPHPYSRSS